MLHSNLIDCLAKENIVTVIRVLPFLVVFTSPAALAEIKDDLTTGLPPVTMEKTDTDNDGRIDRQEFEGRIIEIFHSTDKDGDQRLSRDELGDVNVKAFKKADENKNKKLNLKEYIRFRFADFERVDQDNDNLITPRELKDW